MKDLVQRVRQIGGVVADSVRRAVDPPLDGDARPLDVKRAIVEAVEQQIVPAGGGRRVLPGDIVRVRILEVTDAARPALDGVLGDLRETIAARLRELQCEVPMRLAVDVSYVPAPLSHWADEQRLDVTFESRTGVESAAGETRSITITVVRGEAACASATFTESVIRLGRLADPTDERGRARFNHVAFLENDRPENRTVTRGHAVIRLTGGDYRLFDEGSANGTRVVRRGEVIELPKRDPVGLSLQSGDEVQLGKAAVHVMIR